MAKRFRFELAIYIALPAIGTPEIANGDDGLQAANFRASSVSVRNFAKTRDFPRVFRPYRAETRFCLETADLVAEGAGFEPAIRFTVCTLSKRVP